MLAVRGPQNDYAIARQFLTTDLATEWDPDASATIRTGIPSATRETSDDTGSLDYTITSRAYVDADGRYFETGATSQQTLVHVHAGERRVAHQRRHPTASCSPSPASTPSSPSGRSTSSTRATATSFPTCGGSRLAPRFPAALCARCSLVRPSWLQQGVLLTAFPVATSLGPDAVVERPGAATVDLSVGGLTATAQERDRMRQQLAASLDVSVVAMTVGGVPLSAPLAGSRRNREPRRRGCGAGRYRRGVRLRSRAGV